MVILPPFIYSTSSPLPLNTKCGWSVLGWNNRLLAIRRIVRKNIEFVAAFLIESEHSALPARTFSS